MLHYYHYTMSSSDLTLVHSMLCDAALAPRTVAAYRSATMKFLSWCHSIGVLTLTSPLLLDELVSKYISYCYSNGVVLSVAVNTICGIQHYYPTLKHGLVVSKKAVAGWTRINAVGKQERPPLTLELTTVIAASMAKSGYFNAGVATLLAFDCYLRIGELIGLKISDVALTGSVVFGSAYTGTGVRLAKTKTGINQFVMIRSATVVTLLKLVIGTRTGNEYVFQLTSKQYRDLFHRIIGGLGLSGAGFVPHSLRHGGATTDFMKGLTIETILHRGRWAVSASARTYIHSGQALLLMVNAPQLQILGAKLQLKLEGIMCRHMFTEKV